MKKVLKFLDDHLEEYFVCLLMGYFVTVTVLQVVFRFFLKIPAAWTEETARYSFIWMTFLGSSLVAKLKTHIRVDILESNLTGKTRLGMNLFSQVVFLLFGVICTIIGIRMCASLVTRPQLSPVLKIPMQYIYASFPIGMGLMSMRIVRGLIAQIIGLADGKAAGEGK
ncbi:MAG: TRAP transporter small permease [Treponema sp.]|jgi:TRAP-type C4-dicarboxylate transport system permease small subunit|nr:TRAP transporter small permease [Treponema sp.]